MNSIHPIQIDILKQLLFSISKRYSEIKPQEMESSQFSFHLDKLITQGFISKSKGRYELTDSGKVYANQMDTKAPKMKSHAKLTTKLCCVREVNAKIEYLLYKRLKNPFYGYVGFPTSKVWFGDSIKYGAIRGLHSETNLTGIPKIMAVRHYRVYSKQSKLLEDKVMYIFRFTNPRGEVRSKKDGKFFWAKKKEIVRMKNRFLPEFKEVFNILSRKRINIDFREVNQIVDKF